MEKEKDSYAFDCECAEDEFIRKMDTLEEMEQLRAERDEAKQKNNDLIKELADYSVDLQIATEKNDELKQENEKLKDFINKEKYKAVSGRMRIDCDIPEDILSKLE